MKNAVLCSKSFKKGCYKVLLDQHLKFSLSSPEGNWDTKESVELQTEFYESTLSTDTYIFTWICPHLASVCLHPGTCQSYSLHGQESHASPLCNLLKVQCLKAVDFFTVHTIPSCVNTCGSGKKHLMNAISYRTWALQSPNHNLTITKKVQNWRIWNYRE